MKKRHSKEFLTYLILEKMEERPTYGYELLERLREISGGFFEPSYGTVYGALERLEEDGLIARTEKEHEDRKYFELTDEGREELQKRKGEEEEIRKELRKVALGFLNVYKNTFGDEKAKELLKEVEDELKDIE